MGFVFISLFLIFISICHGVCTQYVRSMYAVCTQCVWCMYLTFFTLAVDDCSYARSSGADHHPSQLVWSGLICFMHLLTIYFYFFPRFLTDED